MHYIPFITFIVVLINDVVSLSSNERYNLGIWGIEPGDSIIILQQSTGYPAQHEDYYVWNLGKGDVWTELLYGTAFSWSGWVVGYTVESGKMKHVTNLDGRYYITALKIANYGKERAIVRARMSKELKEVVGKDSSYDVDFDVNDFAKFFVATVADNIPIIGATLSHVIEFFWPDSEEDVWEEIKGKVEKMTDSKISDAIESILDNNLRKVKKKVKALARSLQHGIKGENVTDHYMNVAQDLIGIEEGFRFSKKNNMDYRKMNYIVLPLYSSIITMKLLFYRMATLDKENLGITDAKLNQIRFYTRELMLDGAFEHVSAVMEERLENAYDTAHPENMFNALVTIWTYCGINALESLPLWENLVHHPESNETVHSDTVTYSTYMGRPTIWLARQVTGGAIGPNLLPGWVNETVGDKVMQVRDYIKSMEIYYTHDHIYGIVTYYKSGDSFKMGNGVPNVTNIVFNGKHMTAIEAYGEDRLKGLSMTFSNNKTVSLGNVSGDKKTVFGLKRHYIAGIFASNGSEFGQHMIVNIAVSYVLDNQYKV